MCMMREEYKKYLQHRGMYTLIQWSRNEIADIKTKFKGTYILVYEKKDTVKLNNCSWFGHSQAVYMLREKALSHTVSISIQENDTDGSTLEAHGNERGVISTSKKCASRKYGGIERIICEK